MNTGKDKTERSELPLPSPRSPRELDDRILAHARRLAPPRKPWLLRNWAPGLATVGVLVVALLVALPRQPYRVPAPDQSPKASSAKIERTEAVPGVLEMAREPLEDRAASPAEEGIMAEKMTATADLAPQASQPPPERGFAADATMIAESDNVARTLALCAELLESGDTEQAHRLYRQLRESCPGCELPATLEQAVAKLDTAGGESPEN